jgi:hypothetical protein
LAIRFLFATETASFLAWVSIAEQPVPPGVVHVADTKTVAPAKAPASAARCASLRAKYRAPTSTANPASERITIIEPATVSKLIPRSPVWERFFRFVFGMGLARSSSGQILHG